MAVTSMQAIGIHTCRAEKNTEIRPPLRFSTFLIDLFFSILISIPVRDYLSSRIISLFILFSIGLCSTVIFNRRSGLGARASRFPAATSWGASSSASAAAAETPTAAPAAAFVPAAASRHRHCGSRPLAVAIPARPVAARAVSVASPSSSLRLHWAAAGGAERAGAGPPWRRPCPTGNGPHRGSASDGPSVTAIAGCGAEE